LQVECKEVKLNQFQRNLQDCNL